jgi:hypothetical protein
MDDAIDLANLAGGLKGDDEQRRVAAGIAIAAVADVTVLDMTLRSKACPVNAAPLLPSTRAEAVFRSPSKLRRSEALRRCARYKRNEGG